MKCVAIEGKFSTETVIVDRNRRSTSLVGFISADGGLHLEHHVRSNKFWLGGKNVKNTCQKISHYCRSELLRLVNNLKNELT